MKRRHIDTAVARAKRFGRHAPGIVGVDWGVKYTDGAPSGRGIRFHVARKRPLNELTATEVLPQSIDGHPCDVVEARYAPHGSPREPHTPIIPGVSIGNVARITTGTLGMFVVHIPTKADCLLSNWHVLAGSTQAVAGDPIAQPGPYDARGEPARIVAHLLRWSNLDHGYDVAIARITDGVAVDALPFGQAQRITSVAEPAVGMRVSKSGIATGLTTAIVDGVNGSYEMDYTPYGDVVRWMDGIRLVPEPAGTDEISMYGDSGAVWLTDGGAAVAINFGGEDGLGPTAEYAVAHRLSRVLELLDARPP